MPSKVIFRSSDATAVNRRGMVRGYLVKGGEVELPPNPVRWAGHDFESGQAWEKRAVVRTAKPVTATFAMPPRAAASSFASVKQDGSLGSALSPSGIQALRPGDIIGQSNAGGLEGATPFTLLAPNFSRTSEVVVKVHMPKGTMVKPIGASDDALVDQNEMRLTFVPETRFRVVGMYQRDLPSTSQGAVESQQSNADRAGSKLPDNQVIRNAEILELEAIPPRSRGDIPVVDITPRLELSEAFEARLVSTARRFSTAFAQLEAKPKTGAKISQMEAFRRRERVNMHARELGIISAQIAYIPEYESQQTLVQEVLSAVGVSKQLEELQARHEREAVLASDIKERPRVPYLRETQRFLDDVSKMHSRSASQYVEFEDKLMNVMDEQVQNAKVLESLRQVQKAAQERVDLFNQPVPDPSNPTARITWGEHIQQMPSGESKEALLADMNAASVELSEANQKVQEHELIVQENKEQHEDLAKDIVALNDAFTQRLEAAKQRHDAYRQTSRHAHDVAELRAQHNYAVEAAQEAEKVLAALPGDSLARVDFDLADARFRQAHFGLEASQATSSVRMRQNISKMQELSPKIATLQAEKMRLLEKGLQDVESYRAKGLEFQARRPDRPDAVAAAMVGIAKNREDLLRAEIQILQARDSVEMDAGVRARDAANAQNLKGLRDIIKASDPKVYGHLRVPPAYDEILERGAHKQRESRYGEVRSIPRDEREHGRPSDNTARREKSRRDSQRIEARVEVAREYPSPLISNLTEPGFDDPMAAGVEENDTLPIGSGLQSTQVTQMDMPIPTPTPHIPPVAGH